MIENKLKPKINSIVDGNSPAAVNDAVEILNRAKRLIGAKYDEPLSKLLGVSRQAITRARRIKKIPPAWIIKIISATKCSQDWLLFGKGEFDQGNDAESIKSDEIQNVKEQIINDFAENLIAHAIKEVGYEPKHVIKWASLEYMKQEIDKLFERTKGVLLGSRIRNECKDIITGS